MQSPFNKNDQKDTQRDNHSFINNPQNDSTKTKSNLIQIPSITLPKGGGAIKSIDEKFSVNSANGTAAYSIPLPFTPGRNGVTPQFSLSYNSGGGNSIFGLGWGIDIPSIQRKTDKKLPEYDDMNESDTFIFSGAEDLVPELIKDNNGNWIRNTDPEGTIMQYRPRIEGGFAGIEKINENGNVYWKVRSKENMVSVFGKSDDAKLFSPLPGEENKIFKWCLEYSYNDKGNFTKYSYKKENKQNIPSSLHEKNRLNDVWPFTNIYLKTVAYGNKTAYYEGNVLPTEFLFELIFDFGEHDIEKPLTVSSVIDNKELLWTCRQDPFSDYHAGFEIRTYRLCRRVLMFHHFPDELGFNDYLVRSLEFSYDEKPHLTYLDKITQAGYIWNADNSLQSKRSFPALEFSYRKPGFSKKVQEISIENVMNAPVGLSDQYQWTDLYSEGISGILVEQANGWYYKENDGDGNFMPAKLVSPKPSFHGLNDGTLTLQDIEANGKKSIVSSMEGQRGYFELTENDEWNSFLAFDNYPNIQTNDPNLKFMDLDGDGMADMLISCDQDFIWYKSKGKAGYDDFNIASKAIDDEKGPTIVFSAKDAKMLIATADMSGDGLADIVLVTYNTVSYYPNLGYGRFGAKVSMKMDGLFDSPEKFNTQYLNFADIDGSGTTDIVYTANEEIQVWFNQSGNQFSEPSVFFNPFPPVDNFSKISFIDLLGNGTSCIVWSSSLPGNSYSPMRYIDIMDGQKPHVMIKHLNNLGKEVILDYQSSAKYYLDDKKNGNKWITKLPFPVQCVSKVTVIDKVSLTRFTNEYAYHHGYYDSIEREFRGFAMVEQRDTESYDHFVKETIANGNVNTTQRDFFQPAVITKSWFHTGAYTGRANFFHTISNEYYPTSLINEGKITDPEIIRTAPQYLMPQQTIPADLSTEELIECSRALKGLPLRQEVYSDEGTAEIKMHPYSVTQNNYSIQCLQPKRTEKHAVFFTHEQEKLAIQYERNFVDPRIAHSINIEIDEFGNVKQSASIVYGRKKSDPQLRDDKDKVTQTKQHITYTLNEFTKKINEKDAYRLPVNYDSQTWELNIAPAAGSFYTLKEVQEGFENAAEALYEEETAINKKRKIEHSKVLFMKNDLSGPMDHGSMDTFGLPFENYLLSFTPSLARDIYKDKFDEALLRGKGLYVQFGNDGNFWIKSGRTYFHPDLSADPFAKKILPATNADILFAKNNFYSPVVFEDNSGNLTKIFYDIHHVIMKRLIDPADNEVNADAVNYRTMMPCILRDANNNISGTRADALGLVTHVFQCGKTGEGKGDFIEPASVEFSINDKPTSFLEYEFNYHTSNGVSPNRVKTSAREKHHFKGTGANPPEIEANIIWQESYSYSDGSGHEVLKKIQAEPGMAPERDVTGKLVKDANGKLQLKDTGNALRWIGNGRTIYNNKGNPVKKYEPFFDCLPAYNNEAELCELGFTPVIFYDAAGRVIKTKNPNGTFSKVEFDAWMQKTWDENDTVSDDECTWFKERNNGQMGEAEQQAAVKTLVHAGTPALTHFDSLARPFLLIAHNKSKRTGELEVTEKFHFTRTYLDIEGNTQKITNTKEDQETEVMNWRYDMLGNICFQHSTDAGDRWMLRDVTGKPLRLWDSRKNIFSYSYDNLHRPLQLMVNDGVKEIVYEKYEYGDFIADAAEARKNNLRTKLFKHFDTAGVAEHGSYDFKGNLIESNRKLISDYKTIPDWKAVPLLLDKAYSSIIKYDALNRPIELTYPDESVAIPGYNPTNLLKSMDVKIKAAVNETNFVTNIIYNAKGQREKIEYNNGTSCFYTYDLMNYRLIKLVTGKSGGNDALQNLVFTYDPVGNISKQVDNAKNAVFYDGQRVEAKNNYTYDAVYRLIEAEGREHTGQVDIMAAADNWNDSWSRLPLQPNSAMQLRGYIQKYFYDEVGNITKMRHRAGDGSWTRDYHYNPANNQLLRTTMGNEANLSKDHDYTYNEHGSILTMPHLSQPIEWNFREEMRHINLIGGGEAWYVYDASGQRIMKVVEKAQQREERIYLGGVEIFSVFENVTNNKKLERETFHVIDDKQRIAMVETKTAGNDASPGQLIRYQYSDHLGTACLELDELAKIISYEEYHPYGTTAYQATDSSREVPSKRYRYTGMERDEESGFNYHSARYYLPWLGRWMNGDPSGIKDGFNIYMYCKSSPIDKTDTNGKESKKKSNITVESSIVILDDAGKIKYAKKGMQIIGPDGKVVKKFPDKDFTKPELKQAQANMDMLKKQMQDQNERQRADEERKKQKFTLEIAINVSSTTKSGDVDTGKNPGHTMLLIKDSKGDVVKSFSYGPINHNTMSMSSLSCSIAGRTDYPLDKTDKYDVFDFTITNDQYEKAVKKIEEIEKSPGTFSSSHQCTTTTLEVVEAAGVTVPKGLGNIHIPLLTCPGVNNVSTPVNLDEELKKDKVGYTTVDATSFSGSVPMKNK